MIAYLRKNRNRTEQPAVFLDRDGTLIHDRPGFYLTDPRRLKFYADAFKALRLLAPGYRLIVVTNQAGIGRGYLTLARSKTINMKFVNELCARGIELDGVYFCPHLPGAGCACRKPGGGLIKEALKHHRINLPRSIVVGDKASDMKLADSLGLTSVLVKTGHGRNELRKQPGLARGRAVKAGILAAARWIKQSHKTQVTGHKPEGAGWQNNKRVEGL